MREPQPWPYDSEQEWRAWRDHLPRAGAGAAHRDAEARRRRRDRADRAVYAGEVGAEAARTGAAAPRGGERRAGLSVLEFRDELRGAQLVTKREVWETRSLRHAGRTRAPRQHRLPF
jgi:hypothetical protein